LTTTNEKKDQIEKKYIEERKHQKPAENINVATD